MSRIDIDVLDRAGGLVADLDPETWSPAGAGVFLDELDDVGGFSINVQADDPDIGDIAAGHIVVVKLDTVPIWRGVIRKMTVREIAEDEADRHTTFQGPGELARLDEMAVYPTGGLGRFPFSDDRTFNWTAPEYDDSGWDAVVVTPANYGTSSENYGLPEGFPDGDADWIWDVSSAGAVPAGSEYFRKTVTIGSEAVREAWSAADDTNEVWIQGVSVLRSSDANYVGETTAVELLVSAGSTTVAARATNNNALKAGFLFTLIAPLAETAGVIATDASWLVAPDGAELGMNAGQILNVLLDEYEARGGDGPARTWTDSLDSNGDPWTVFEEVTVPVGATYLEVLRQLIEMEMCDVRMSPDAFEMNLYVAGGAGTTIAYTLGDTNLTSLTWDAVPSTATALLTRWARGYTQKADSALVTAHGRRESLLGLGGVAAQAVAESQAGQVIARFGEDRAEIAAGVDPESTADEPYTKYWPGYSITAPGPGGPSVQRVMAIGMGLDEAGNPTWDVHLNNHLEEAEKRQQLLLQRLSSGSVGGRSATSTVPYQPRALKPRDPQEISWSTGSTVTTVVGDVKSFPRAVRIREFRMELKGTITGTYTARLLKNGVAVAGSSVSRSSEGVSYVTLAEVVDQRPAGNIRAEITAVGSGATGMTLTAVYA